MTQIDRIAIRSATDIVIARGVARKVASQIGFPLADQTRLATAVSELTRNALQYGEGGECEIRDESNDSEKCIRVVVEDHGPGIANVDMAMQDGYSTGGGLGAGLPGTRRLMDTFKIESRPGLTRVGIALIRKRS